MDLPERLAAIEDIKQLKARYFRCMDTKDWAGFATVFAPDAEMDMRGEDPASGLNHGAQVIAEYVRNAVDALVTVHHGHMPEIEVTSETTATGVWAMEDLLRWPEGSGSAITWMHGFGHYHETYERIDGSWRITTLRLTRLRVDVG
jgi:hypothetical protein